jgi:hypothetical protein
MNRRKRQETFIILVLGLGKKGAIMEYHRTRGGPYRRR